VDRCTAGCTVVATCTELTDVFCNGVTNTFYTCAANCAGVSPAAPPSGSFYCNDGEAIPASWRCDDYADCTSGEDEVGCDFVCSNGTTIPQSYVCDGYNDCSTGEDEANCGATYTCLDGYVIPVSAVCDGYVHCTSGDDESDCGGGTFPICGASGQ
jgi:hypothetical protein